MNTKISPRFWTDTKLEETPPDQKLAILWMLTNPRINICGCFEFTERRFTFETGLEAKVLHDALKALGKSVVHFPDGNIVFLRNFIREQFGHGDALKKNNIFKAVFSVWDGIRHESLKSVIAEEYPELETPTDFVPAHRRHHQVSLGLKFAIAKRDGFRCLYTNEVLTMDEIQIDHIVPLSKGGKTVPENLVVVSTEMNLRKSNRSMEAFCKMQGLDFKAVSEEIRVRTTRPIQYPVKPLSEQIKPFRSSTKDKEKEKEKEQEKEQEQEKEYIQGESEGELLPPEPEREPEPGEQRYRRSATRQLARDIILPHLNMKTEREYGPIDSNIEPIAIRLEEVSLDTEGVKTMIDRQCALWKTDERMAPYLRLTTLFGKTKFHEYYSARNLPINPTINRQPDHTKGF